MHRSRGQEWIYAIDWREVFRVIDVIHGGHRPETWLLVERLEFGGCGFREIGCGRVGAGRKPGKAAPASEGPQAAHLQVCRKTGCRNQENRMQHMPKSRQTYLKSLPDAMSGCWTPSAMARKALPCEPSIASRCSRRLGGFSPHRQRTRNPAR